MTVLPFRSPLCGVVLAASAHGISDALTPMRLWRYAIIPIRLHDTLTSSLFFVGSFIHFSQDIGARQSLLMHVSLCALAGINYQFACTLMCIYYLVLHFPLHILRVYQKSQLCSLVILASFFLILPFTIRINEFGIPGFIQRAVFAHAMTDNIKKKDLKLPVGEHPDDDLPYDTFEGEGICACGRTLPKMATCGYCLCLAE